MLGYTPSFLSPYILTLTIDHSSPVPCTTSLYPLYTGLETIKITMANDPEAISLSTLPSYTSSRPPSYGPIQEPPKAQTFTRIERSVYEPPAAQSSPESELSPGPSSSPSRLRRYLDCAMKIIGGATVIFLLGCYVLLPIGLIIAFLIGLYFLIKEIPDGE